MTDNAPELLTATEAARRLGVSPKTVRRWVNDGRIDHVALPSGHVRIPEDALPERTRATAGG